MALVSPANFSYHTGAFQLKAALLFSDKLDCWVFCAISLSRKNMELCLHVALIGEAEQNDHSLDYVKENNLLIKSNMTSVAKEEITFCLFSLQPPSAKVTNMWSALIRGSFAHHTLNMKRSHTLNKKSRQLFIFACTTILYCCIITPNWFYWIWARASRR